MNLTNSTLLKITTEDTETSQVQLSLNDGQAMFHYSLPEGIDPLSLQNCSDIVLQYEPTCMELFHILGATGWLIFGLATSALVVCVSLFLSTLVHVQKYVQGKYKSSTGIVMSVYPVLSLCMYLSILFPKANITMDASAQLYFSVCMYHFFRLSIQYFGGETAFVQTLEGQVLPWKAPPCCCFPCFWPCLPKSAVSKRQVKMLRGLILQHPFVQAICTIIGITFYVEGWLKPMQFSSQGAYGYIVCVTTTSFCFALWAFVTGFRASMRALKEFCYKGKILSFQLTLIFLRLQALIVSLILLPTNAIPCIPPLSPVVLANLILSSLVLGQLVCLTVLARHSVLTSRKDKIDYNSKDIQGLINHHQTGI